MIQKKLTIIFLTFGCSILIPLIIINSINADINNEVSTESHLRLVQSELAKVRLEQYLILNERFLEESFYSNDSLNFAHELNKLNEVKSDLYYFNNELNDMYGSEVGTIINLLNSYYQLRSDLILTLKQRGHKNHGLVGKMREKAHKLEYTNKTSSSQAQILRLRRHEKDYLLRRDKQYIIKAEQLVSLLITDPKYSKESRRLLLAYIDDLKQVNRLNEKIGLSRSIRPTILNQINETFNTIDFQLKSIESKSIAHIHSLRHKQRFITGISYSILIIVIGYISLILAKNLSARLRHVSEVMKSYIESNYQLQASNFTYKKDEIGALETSLDIVMYEISEEFEQFKKRAKYRTDALLNQRNQILKQQQLLQQEITLNVDSLNYAKRIQDALLPSRKRLIESLGNVYMLYQPKNIVSGDFYWCHTIGQYSFLALADCTGHGVPGAFLSIIGQSLLKEAVTRKQLFDPGAILDYLDHKIGETINANNTKKKVTDSMDISIVKIDNKNGNLSFCGAKTKALIASNGKIIELKGSRKALGEIRNDHKSYSEFERNYNLLKEDVVWLHSDGIIDQFGGSKGKKLRSNNFKEFLTHVRIENKTVDLELINFFETWKGDEEQVDDVCVIGFKPHLSARPAKIRPTEAPMATPIPPILTP